MRPLLIFAAAMFALTARAQQYGSYNYFGKLYGDNHVKGFQAQTIHGVHFGSEYVGVGIGIDHYGIESIPFFINLNHKLFRQSNFYVSLNAGGQLMTSKNLLIFSQNEQNRLVPSYEPGLGYLVRFGKARQGILIHGGYSFKHIRIRASSTQFNPDPEDGPAYDVFDYRYNRIAIRIGFQF